MSTRWRPLVLGFVATRAFMITATTWPIHASSAKGDIDLYAGWAAAVFRGAMPYSDVPIEYPPGSLPFVIVPRLFADLATYRVAFLILMVVIDVVALLGVVAISGRTGIRTGPWIWILATFLLGPIIYLRLDLIPAAATIWAIERASARAAGASGALMAFAAAAKLYPVLLIPAAAFRSLRNRAFIVGAGSAAAASLLPFVGVLPDLWDSVIGYHSERGIQFESSWGTALGIASRRGYAATLEKSFGAIHVRSAVSPTLETVSAALAIATVIAGTWLILRTVPRGDDGRLATGLYGMLAIVMFFGTVLSPQFIVWLIALSAVALCFDIPSVRRPLLLIVPIAALTQLEFPFMFNALKSFEPEALIVLSARNLLILGSGLTALIALRTDETKVA